MLELSICYHISRDSMSGNGSISGGQRTIYMGKQQRNGSIRGSFSNDNVGDLRDQDGLRLRGFQVVSILDGSHTATGRFGHA